MFRFVVSPDGVLVPDLAGKLPGRGIWLSASRDVIEGREQTTRSGLSGINTLSGATSRDLVRAVARAARGPVRVPPDLLAVLEAALVRRIGDFLGLARRSGQAVAGFEKARDRMRTRSVGLVLQAADGSEAERARFRSAVPDAVPVCAPVRGTVLGRVFGHETVVHVAVERGRLADALIADARRLAGLTGTSTGTSAATTSDRVAAGTPETARDDSREPASPRSPGVADPQSRRGERRPRARAETTPPEQAGDETRRPPRRVRSDAKSREARDTVRSLVPAARPQSHDAAREIKRESGVAPRDAARRATAATSDILDTNG
jgi:uncharacterized protein